MRSIRDRDVKSADGPFPEKIEGESVEIDGVSTLFQWGIGSEFVDIGKWANRKKGGIGQTLEKFSESDGETVITRLFPR